MRVSSPSSGRSRWRCACRPSSPPSTGSSSRGARARPCGACSRTTRWSSRCASGGLPVLGTCAGAILLARQIAGEGPSPLGVMDLVVSRNAYGRQVDSFEAELDVPALGAPPVPAVFIRAPRILEIGPGVEVLARLDGGEVVAVRQGPRLALTFHPELTGDLRFHRYFLQQIVGRDDASGAA